MQQETLPGMVVFAINLSTQESEVGRSLCVPGYPALLCETLSKNKQTKFQKKDHKDTFL